MTALRETIAAFRNSVGAILRIQKRGAGEADLSINGSAWCISENRYFVTAHHVLGGGGPRESGDKFVLFVAPDNGPRAYHFALVDIPFADAALDLAIVEVGPPSDHAVRVPAVPVTARPIADGSPVLTLGFPSPTIGAANIDNDLNWMGGEVFLKSHANEGIVSAAYELNGVLHYELNVGWHHGESGGPVIALDDGAAFSVMQQYRNISTPLGTVAGPHMGRALSYIEGPLREHGARFV